MRDTEHLRTVIENAYLERMRERDKMNSRHNPYGRPGNTPRTIIVHAMGEHIMMDDGKTFEHAPDFLERMKLSVHALIAPDGTIIRCRDDSETAYHAQGYNTNSLGMEMLVAGRHDYGSFVRTIAEKYLTDAQYEAAVKQCREWVSLHKIERIVRHSDVSPGRKLDPGAGFPFDKFLADVRKT